MTIKLLASYGKYRCNDIITLDGTTETAMIAAGLATATLTGGTQWVDINADDQPSALTDAEKAWVRSSVSGGGVTPSVSQWALAVIIPSSGSIGNNGALSGITALPVAHSWGCFMYFPANAIAAGVAAGFYFVVMSSTSAGTIYNNTYTTGVPAVPATLVPFVTTGPGAYTQVTTAVDMATITIPAGRLGTAGRIIATPAFIFVNSATTKTLSMVFGGTSLYSKNRTTTTTELPFLDVRNRGVTGRQLSAWGSAGLPAISNTGGVVNSAVDTTVDVPLIFRGQLSAVATDYLVLECGAVEVWPG